MKIERRRAVVALYQGNYESELADLSDRAMSALRREETKSSRRMGTKSEANQLAVEYDNLLAEAEETTVNITVWAITWQQWDQLVEKHPPREGNDDDQAAGFNFSTLQNDVLLASLVEPEQARKVDSLEELLLTGKRALTEMGDLSRTHYAKLRQSAWTVNAGDDSIPKGSLVSAIRKVRALDSEPPQDSA